MPLENETVPGTMSDTVHSLFTVNTASFPQALHLIPINALSELSIGLFQE